MADCGSDTPIPILLNTAYISMSAADDSHCNWCCIVFLVLQRMRRVCPEWLDPPFSHFRKLNAATAWPRLVRTSSTHTHCITDIQTFLHCMGSTIFIRLLLTGFLGYYILCICVFIRSKWVGADSRKKRDLQQDPKRWTFHSNPNRP